MVWVVLHAELNVDSDRLFGFSMPAELQVVRQQQQ